MRIAWGTFISALWLSVLPSFGAMVMPEQGIVLVNRGNGYETATGPTIVNPGDIVVVNPGGSAKIAYGNGCTVPVAIGSIVTVSAQSPCTTQGSMTPTQGTTPPQGGTPPEGEGTPPDTAATPDGTGIAELAVNVTLAGAAVGGILLSQKDKDKPASP